MRILLVITKSELGGAQSHVLEVATYLNSMNNDIKVVTGDEGWLTQKLTEDNVPWEILPGLRNTYNPSNLLKLILKLRKLINSFRPDIVHGHSSIAGFVTRFSSMGLSTKSVFTMHGTPYAPAYSFKHRLLSGMAELVANWLTDTTVIYVSELDLRISEKLWVAPLDKSKKIVIYNGISEAPAHIQNRSEEIKVLMTARFDYPKDHLTVIKAASELKNEPFHFDFIGDGSLKHEAEALASSLNLKNVTFLGAINDAKNLLPDYDIFLLSSRTEGLPISILEAMSSSLPVVASNVGGIPEVVQNEYNGYLFEPGNIDSLKSSLLKLKNPSMREKLGQNSRKSFMENFTRESMLKKLSSLYLDVIRS